MQLHFFSSLAETSKTTAKALQKVLNTLGTLSSTADDYNLKIDLLCKNLRKIIDEIPEELPQLYKVLTKIDKLHRENLKDRLISLEVESRNAENFLDYSLSPVLLKLIVEQLKNIRNISKAYQTILKNLEAEMPTLKLIVEQLKNIEDASKTHQTILNAEIPTSQKNIIITLALNLAAFVKPNEKSIIALCLDWYVGKIIISCQEREDEKVRNYISAFFCGFFYGYIYDRYDTSSAEYKALKMICNEAIYFFNASELKELAEAIAEKKEKTNVLNPMVGLHGYSQ